ncbi:MAG: hypothetical protein U1E81_21595 [Xanthobacteraceae bacterium]
MSDGPHRTLPLRHAWKRLAKRADKRAYDSRDVIDAICPALERDCAVELTNDFMKKLRTVCGSGQLFGEYTDGDIEALKRLAAGRGSLGGVVADFTAEALATGKTGDQAVRYALDRALHDRMVRNARSIEEHYLRESSARRAADVRSRLENAIPKAGIGMLAAKLATAPASSKAAPPKHQGVDDGVTMP